MTPEEMLNDLLVQRDTALAKGDMTFDKLENMDRLIDALMDTVEGRVEYRRDAGVADINAEIDNLKYEDKIASYSEYYIIDPKDLDILINGKKDITEDATVENGDKSSETAEIGTDVQNRKKIRDT